VLPFLSKAISTTPTMKEEHFGVGEVWKVSLPEICWVVLPMWLFPKIMGTPQIIH